MWDLVNRDSFGIFYCVFDEPRSRNDLMEVTGYIIDRKP